jgi:hypothetical protein
MPSIKCTPVRLTYNGSLYRIYADGSVSPALTVSELKKLQFSTAQAVLEYESSQLPRYPPESSVARVIRQEATRLRRNRNARERTQVMKDLGLKRGSGGAFGGWE